MFLSTKKNKFNKLFQQIKSLELINSCPQEKYDEISLLCETIIKKEKNPLSRAYYERKLLIFNSTSKPHERVLFTDVVGLEDIKALVKKNIIMKLKHPEIYNKYNSNKNINGILLFGPPGTGKTLIAKAIAGETNATLFLIKISDIYSKWYGESSKNLNAIFEKAKNCSLSIIFIDEIDGLLASKEESGEEHNTIVNSFLQQIGGFLENNSNIILIGATNYPWKIEKAVLRAGRFSDQFYVRLPNEEERLLMIKKELNNIELDKDIDLSWVANFTKGASGAEISEMMEKIKIELAYNSILHNTTPLLTKPYFQMGRKLLKRNTTEEMLSNYESFDKQGKASGAIIDNTITNVSYGMRKFFKSLFKKKNKE